ncbi:GDP-mannose 3,5-epimerase [Trifolium repens]|nr:GDP-mannose 3,5-epimerase [Trifolium repens]
MGWRSLQQKCSASIITKILELSAALGGSITFMALMVHGKTRSFTFIDECVEGVLRLTKSDFREPVNIGSDEMVSMNEMAEIVLSFENKSIPIQHIPGPEGVRGRNSDNTLIKEKLGWAPTMKLKVLMLLIG